MSAISGVTWEDAWQDRMEGRLGRHHVAFLGRTTCVLTTTRVTAPGPSADPNFGELRRRAARGAHDAGSQRVERMLAAHWPSASILFMDEVQNVAGWELFVSRLQRLGYNLVITGSNSKLLSRDAGDAPDGPLVAIEVFPFSFT
jgi:hypothetical protein